MRGGATNKDAPSSLDSSAADNGHPSVLLLCARSLSIKITSCCHVVVILPPPPHARRLPALAGILLRLHYSLLNNTSVVSPTSSRPLINRSHHHHHPSAWLPALPSSSPSSNHHLVIFSSCYVSFRLPPSGGRPKLLVTHDLTRAPLAAISDVRLPTEVSTPPAALGVPSSGSAGSSPLPSAPAVAPTAFPPRAPPVLVCCWCAPISPWRKSGARSKRLRACSAACRRLSFRTNSVSAIPTTTSEHTTVAAGVKTDVHCELTGSCGTARHGTGRGARVLSVHGAQCPSGGRPHCHRREGVLREQQRYAPPAAESARTQGSSR